MKTIERFKFPVFVAASLHGALLLSIPATQIPTSTRPDTPVVLPPLPKEDILQITETDPVNGESTPSSAGRSVSELPDLPVMLPDKDAFVTPIVKITPTKGIDVDVSKPPGNPNGTDLGWRGPGSGGPPIMDFTKLDRVPRATVQPAPDYPRGLQQEGVTGSVMIEFVVNPEGRVVRAEALRYTHREFVEPAVRAVLKWRFEPGRHHGKPTAFRMAVPIEFAVGRD